VKLKMPQSEGKLLALLEAKAIVHSRKYREGSVYLEVEAPESVLRKVQQFKTSEFDPIKIKGEPLPKTALRDRR
jgi:hypothetical protein